MEKTKIDAWLDQDVSEADKVKLQQLVSEAKEGIPAAMAELADSFKTQLSFGTAGLRGKLGVGPNRMNRAVVIKTAYALTKYLTSQIANDYAVVIGYDARHGSKQFATDTAAVITAAGGKAFLFADYVATPILAYALKQFNYDAAVMVTASHNPAQDNGYKVYLGGKVVTDEGQGAQIVAPVDIEIFNYIKSAPAANKIPLANSGWQLLADEVLESYLAQLGQLVPPAERDLKIVYTPMHGVGGDVALKALTKAGFKNVYPVKEQFMPDADFPSVAFPNPEEAGALDLAIRLANQVHADLIIANDPDADRCSVAISCPLTKNGWRQLTGDEMGVILADYFATKYRADPLATLANSVVSSRLLAKIAQANELNYQATLTGFKYVARVANLVYGYEESIGFNVLPQLLKDKDGISAALLLAYLAQQQKNQMRDLASILTELAVKYGLYITKQVSVRVSDLTLITATMAKLRQAGLTKIANSAIVECIDFQHGYQHFPPTDMIIYVTLDNDRIIVRPSGTEPKLKFYLDTVVAVKTAMSIAQEVAAKRIAELELSLLKQLNLNT